MPIVLNSIVFCSLLSTEMHYKATVMLGLEEKGPLRTNALAWFVYKDLHLSCFDIDKINSLAPTNYNKWECFDVKAWESSHSKFLVITRVRIFDDVFDCDPIMND